MPGPIPLHMPLSLPQAAMSVPRLWESWAARSRGDGEHLRMISPSILHTRTVIAWPYSSAIWELTSSKVTYRKTKGGSPAC